MGSSDFFLEPDDSKSFGDVNFMRKPVRVRRTFPKTIKNPNGFEVVKETSSVDQKNFNNFNGNSSFTNNTSFNGNGAVNGNGNGSSNGNSASFEPQSDREQNSFEPRKVDSNLDMFRNMARNMKR
ncbi:MAG: hypothetical protein ACRC2R_06190 [Xenococcaceae cyanobacterium]